MKRLTINKDTQYDFIGKYDTNIEEFTNNDKLRISVMNKLGQLEDIEEELGIDLITLFKALKNGIWSKGGFYEDQIADKPTFIKKPEIMLCDYYQETDEYYNMIIDEENVWCIYTYDYEIMVRQTRLKDYGKTWALTKEELE